MTDGCACLIILLVTAPLKIVEVQTKHLEYFSRNIQSFGLRLICMVNKIDGTRETAFKLTR